MRSPTRTIVIVGGGFCGTVLAVNLLRRPPRHRTRIVVVERRAEIGRGLAYRDGPSQHLLNVPAGRMSADSRDPAQFVKFAQRHIGDITAGDFLPRRLYGEYLQDLLQTAERGAPGHIHLERVHGQACAIKSVAYAGSYLVEVAGHGEFRADDVVLASGDPPPVGKPFTTGIEGHAGYAGDPYDENAHRTHTRSLLLIGTGLTAADAVVTAATLNPGITIHAVSRHGLVPAVQGGGTLNTSGLDMPESATDAPPTARRLLAQFRSLIGKVERRGGDWRDAMMIARRAAPRLWQRLSVLERQRFLRHLRTRWDVYRHRLPPAVAARLYALRDAGQLHIHSGHIRLIESEAEKLRVLWRPRGTPHTRQLLVERVMNCTGADQRVRHSSDPLLRNLLESGLAIADPLGIGLRTGPNGGLVDRDGHAC